MHFFTYKSVLSVLAETLMAASVNVGSDEAVTKFFINYGYAQGCAMCLSLAIGCGPAASSNELQNRARRAALSRAFVPKLVRKEEQLQDLSGARDMSSPDNNAEIPPGYEFHPSALADGLIALVSRLLRPVWCKPAVVVTEGQTVRLRSGHEKSLPAKVELLLDEVTLEEIRKPLHSLQLFMREVFVPAISVVPGLQRQDSDRMDVEEMNGSGGSTLTDAMRFHAYVRGQTQYGTENRFTPEDAGAMAKLIEERNLHSLYRLVSRSVQLLTLLSFLKRAQYLPELHGVEWGLLHGLTMAQLVQMRDCQERIDRLLSSMVSPSNSSPVSNVAPTAESDQLATLLASECYLYFSPGSHYAYMGFRSAGEAISCAPSSARRAALTNQTTEYLKRAARHWYSAPLITGRILHGQENESYEQTALRAMRFDSPLAKAAAVLFQLQDVGGIVEVCLTAASNFGGRHKKQEPPGSPGSIFDSGSEMLPWERVLYHKRCDGQEGNRGQNFSTTPSSPSSALVLGADVTPKDALSTCHAILFHYLSTLLNSPNTELAQKMIDACAASSDKEFLHSMYEHLIRTKCFSALLQISSTDLELWLARPDMDVELLWQYYREQGKDAQGGEVLRKQACETMPDLDIDVRINLLRKALSSYTVALQKTSESGRGYEGSGWSRPWLSEADREALQSIYTEVSETLDVAVLQSRILRTVASSSLESKLDEQQVSKLQSTLIPVSDLYNEYAAPLNLSDVCLLILHSCRHSDASTIETLWRNVMCEEIFPCATHSADAYQFLQSLMAGSVVDESITLLPEGRTSSLPLFEEADWVLTLQDRMISLGKEVYGNGADYVFPIDFLVSTLEGLRHALLSSKSRAVSMSGRGKPWPLQIIVQVGVPFSACFEAYDNLSVREERELMGGIEAQRRYVDERSLPFFFVSCCF
jgi:nuclear pore complex protein Nup155